MRDHPCLSCILPDCDERSKACLLRLAVKSAQAKDVAGLPLTEREQLACGERHVRNKMATNARAKARAQGIQEVARGTQEAARHA